MASNIPSQRGKRIVVTGANSGTGYELALELCRAGADVTLACRNPDRGHDAVARIERDLAGTNDIGTAVFRRLDLADLSSVRAFAEAWDGPLDVLINNAGIMAIPLDTTVDGFESQFGVNHLGHFALTNLLMPALLSADAPRVVTMSSVAHKMGRIDFTDLQGRRRYGKWKQYGQSKLANLMFGLELERRARAAGSHLMSIPVHPGGANTNLMDEMAGNNKTVNAVVGWLVQRLTASANDAAQSALLAATSPAVKGGEYWGPGGPGNVLGAPTINTPTRTARNAETARWLWVVSEELTGVTAELV